MSVLEDVFAIYVNFQELTFLENRESLETMISKGVKKKWGSNLSFSELQLKGKVVIVLADEVQELFTDTKKEVLNKINRQDLDTIHHIGILQCGGATVVTSGSSSQLPYLLSSHKTKEEEFEEKYPFNRRKDWNNQKHQYFTTKKNWTLDFFKSFILSIVSLEEEKTKILKNSKFSNQKNFESVASAGSVVSLQHPQIVNYLRLICNEKSQETLNMLYRVTAGNFRTLATLLETVIKFGALNFDNVILNSKKEYDNFGPFEKLVLKIVTQSENNEIQFTVLKQKIRQDKQFPAICVEKKNLEQNLDFQTLFVIDKLNLKYETSSSGVSSVSCNHYLWKIFSEAENNNVDYRLIEMFRYSATYGIIAEIIIGERLAKFINEKQHLNARNLQTKEIIEIPALSNLKLAQEKKIPDLIPQIFVGSLEDLEKKLKKLSVTNENIVFVTENEKVKKDLRLLESKNLSILSFKEADGLMGKLIPDKYGFDLIQVKIQSKNLIIYKIQQKIGYSKRNYDEILGKVKFEEEFKEHLNTNFQNKNIEMYNIILTTSPISPIDFNSPDWFQDNKLTDTKYEKFYYVSRKELSKIWPKELLTVHSIFSNEAVLFAVLGFHEAKYLPMTYMKKILGIKATTNRRHLETKITEHIKLEVDSILSQKPNV